MTNQFDKSNPPWYDQFCNSLEIDKNITNNPWQMVTGCATSQTSNYINSSINNTSSPYFYSLPYDIDIFREVNQGIYAIENSEVKLRTLFFISSFQQIFMNNRKIIESFGQLPPLNFNIQSDQSVIIEWIFANFRIGFCFEIEEEESSWYIVSNKYLDEKSYSNYLNKMNVEILIYNILNFVLKNK